jgi:hypothetical protein
MKVALHAGAELDVLTQGELAKELDTFSKAMRRIVGARPRVRSLEQRGIVPAAGPLDIDLGAPPTGQAWDLRRLSVVSQDPTAAIVGTAIVYRAEPGVPTNVVDGAGTGMPSPLPNFGTYSAFQITLRQDEHLFVRLTGGTPDQVIWVPAQVIMLPMGDVFETRSEA